MNMLNSNVVYVSSFKASDLFMVEAVTASASRPVWSNLKFVLRKRDEQSLLGGGIYTIYYKGKLLYVGKFTGKRKIPFVANVAGERFWKHLESLTMRGCAVGFSEANYDEVLRMPDGPLVSDLRHYRGLRGKGSVRAYPSKVAFATEHWTRMSSLEHDVTVLDDFEFVYGRIGKENFADNVTYNEVKNYIGVIEGNLIIELHPRCNVRFARSRRDYLKVGPEESVWEEFKKRCRDKAGN